MFRRMLDLKNRNVAGAYEERVSPQRVYYIVLILTASLALVGRSQVIHGFTE